MKKLFFGKGKFGPALATGVLLLLLLFLLLYAAYLANSEEASIKYHELVRQSCPERLKQEASTYSTSQKREGVMKSIWAFHDGQRKEFRLFADTSLILFDQVHGKTALVERLKNARGVIQEEILEVQDRGHPVFMQRLALFDAEDAELKYGEKCLEAKKTHFLRLEMPGNTLSEDLDETSANKLAEGDFESLKVFSDENGMRMRAKNLHAEGVSDAIFWQLDSPNGYAEKRSIFFDGGVKISYGSYQVESAALWVEKGETGSIPYKAIKAEGGVKIDCHSDRKSVVCHALNYDGRTKEIVLHGEGKKNLVHYVESSKEDPSQTALKISAESARLTLDPKTDSLEKLHMPNEVFLELQEGFSLKGGSADYHCNLAERQESLVIKGPNVVKKQANAAQGGFELENDQEMRFLRIIDGNEKVLSKISCYGQTCCKWGNDSQEMICRGIVQLEPLKDEVKIWANSGEQLVLKDKRGEVRSDFAKIAYSKSEGQYHPVKITLEGNIRFLGKGSLIALEKEEPQYLALADHAEFMIETKELYFSANEKKRVLFYDKQRDLKVSAPALKAKWKETAGLGEDSITSINGIGDVRFSFAETEFELLRQKFSLGSFGRTKND